MPAVGFVTPRRWAAYTSPVPSLPPTDDPRHLAPGPRPLLTLLPVAAVLASVALVLALTGGLPPGDDGGADLRAAETGTTPTAPVAATTRPTQDVLEAPAAIEPAPGQRARQLRAALEPGTAVPDRQTALPVRRLARQVEERTTCQPETVERELTVLSYNIKSGFASGRGLQLDDYARAIAATAADVVLLQEVDRNRAFSRRTDQPGILGAQLGMQNAFGANVLRSGGSQYGTAILSRFPIEESANRLLPFLPGKGMQQRGLLHATIDVDGVPVSLYSTHLQNRSEPSRMAQARAINQVMAADPLPKVLGGDMNAHPTSAPMRTLAATMVDSWPSSGAGPGFTHPSVNLRGRIDYLLHGGSGITPLASSVPAVTLSDHRPVRTTYQVQGVVETC